MAHYGEIANLLSCNVKTIGMVYSIKNKQSTVAAAHWNVQQYFIVRSELNQSADKKKWSLVSEEELVSNEFSENLMHGKTYLLKAKRKTVTSPL